MSTTPPSPVDGSQLFVAGALYLRHNRAQLGHHAARLGLRHFEVLLVNVPGLGADLDRGNGVSLTSGTGTG